MEYWSFQVWVAIKWIVEGIAPRAPQAGICVAGGVAAPSKRCDFSPPARPRASLRVGRVTIVTAAISDRSPWSGNDTIFFYRVHAYCDRLLSSTLHGDAG